MTTPNSERDDFEAWAKRHTKYGDVSATSKQLMWYAWSAARASIAPNTAQLQAVEPDAWLVTYREETKSGNIKCCTEATLDANSPFLMSLPDVKSRELISKGALYLSTPPAQLAVPEGYKHKPPYNLS